MLSSDVQNFVTEFRQDLDFFYQRLQLTPPYNSVEKALSCLATKIQPYTTEEQQKMVSDQTFKWRLFQEAIIESGLNKKHRGIIVGLIQNQDQKDIPEVQRYMEKTFLSSPF